MDKIQYVGEALWIGYLCKAFIIGGFVAALLSAVSYTFSSWEAQLRHPHGKDWAT